MTNIFPLLPRNEREREKDGKIFRHFYRCNRDCSRLLALSRYTRDELRLIKKFDPFYLECVSGEILFYMALCL